MTELSTPPAAPSPRTGRDKRRPDLDSLFSVNPDGSHNVIQPADVRGRFTRLKNFLWPLLIGIYVAMPWVKIGGNPAILIDIPRRHFYLFGNTFTAQDFWLAFFWVTGIGFTLFVVSALFGRLWCIGALDLGHIVSQRLQQLQRLGVDLVGLGKFVVQLAERSDQFFFFHRLDFQSSRASRWPACIPASRELCNV